MRLYKKQQHHNLMDELRPMQYFRTELMVGYFGEEAERNEKYVEEES